MLWKRLRHIALVSNKRIKDIVVEALAEYAERHDNFNCLISKEPTNGKISGEIADEDPIREHQVKANQRVGLEINREVREALKALCEESKGSVISVSFRKVRRLAPNASKREIRDSLQLLTERGIARSRVGRQFLADKKKLLALLELS